MARDIESLLRQQAALADLGSYALKELDPTKLLTEAARLCAASFGVLHCTICRYRSVEDDLLVEAGFGWRPGVVGHAVLPANEKSPQGRAFVTGKPVIVRNLSDSDDYQRPHFYADHGIVSTIGVLIKTQSGPPFGVLEIDSVSGQAYDEQDIDFLTRFANMLAEAMVTHNRSHELCATLARLTATIEEKNRLLDERDVLALELQHRVRNNLQLVSNMLNDQLKVTVDANGRGGLRGIIRRVMSLSEVYEHLLGVGMNGQIDFGAYATALCASLPDLQPESAFPITLRCEPKVLLVPLPAATALGLVLTELVSNSFEHAFPARGGTIDVCFQQDERPNEGVVTIADDGIGYVHNPETKRLGVGLARRLMQQVGGTLDVASDEGTTWTLRFPVLSAAATSDTLNSVAATLRSLSPVSPV